LRDRELTNPCIDGASLRGDRLTADESSDRCTEFGFGGSKSDDLADVADLGASSIDTQRLVGLIQQQRSCLIKRLRRMRFSVEDAEDIVQETCMRLLRVRNVWGGEREVRAFMFKIATNLALDELRRRKTRFRDQHEPYDAVELVCHAPRPDELFDQHWAAQLIEGAMRRMSPRSRQVFSMHIDRDMSYRLIARRLGVSTKTVERDFDAARELCLHKCRLYGRSRA